MQLKQILKFETIKQLPENFFCQICFDVCRQPIVEDRYNELNLESCDHEIKVIYNYSSSYLQFLITYDCDLCGKKLNYWNSANHYMKCQDLVLTLTDMMTNFEHIASQEIEKCSKCDQVAYKPKQYQGKVVCIFCQHQNALENLEELSKEQINTYNHYQIRCKQCFDILYMQEAFIHFKMCSFNENKYDINLFETYQYVKQLRKYQKENDKLFNIDRRKHIIGVQDEKKFNSEINKTKVEQKRLARKLKYLKQLVNQYEQ